MLLGRAPPAVREPANRLDLLLLLLSMLPWLEEEGVVLGLELDPAVSDGVDATFFLARPNSVWLTLFAKRREHKVSGADSVVGDTLTIIMVFPLPLKHPWSINVSLELRNGTCVPGFC